MCKHVEIVRIFRFKSSKYCVSNVIGGVERSEKPADVETKSGPSTIRRIDFHCVPSLRNFRDSSSNRVPWRAFVENDQSPTIHVFASSGTDQIGLTMSFECHFHRIAVCRRISCGQQSQKARAVVVGIAKYCQNVFDDLRSFALDPPSLSTGSTRLAKISDA